MSSSTSEWAARAIAHVEERALPGQPLDRSLRVTLAFHPDRLVGGRTVVACLARDGVYRSQFETGTSGGGTTAHPGGDRWVWERRLFGGAYDDAPPAERPRYGALDHRQRPLGGAPRFGSAHLRLREHTLDRSTFCFPDSVFAPTAFATSGRFGLLHLVATWDARPLTDEREATEGGLLDDYVEAHVHGPVQLADDVEALVLDPCFRGTQVEADAAALTAATGVPIEWHEGRVLDVDVLAAHPGYRGPRTVEVGGRIAEDGSLDAALVGRAVAAGVEDPHDLKKVWHCIARFGRPVR